MRTLRIPHTTRPSAALLLAGGLLCGAVSPTAVAQDVATDTDADDTADTGTGTDTGADDSADTGADDAAADTADGETGLNGVTKDTWLPLTAAADAPLPEDPFLDTDDCRFDSEAPAAWDSDAVRTDDTAPYIPVGKPGPGGEGLDTCGTVAADGVDLPDRLSLGSYLLYDVDSGDVLAAKDSYGLYRPASVIKILLVMTALDELDMDQTVPVTADMVDIDGSKVGIGPGGTYTALQLLQGLVMNSGNDAALALAEALGGKDATVTKMQDLADSLGATGTRVTTVNGLDTPDVQTTAYDLALFYRAAFARSDVRDLLGTETVPFPGYDDYPGFDISSDNYLLFDYPGAVGGKTGYTDNARHTYAAAAERDGRTLGVVMLNSTIAAGRPWEQAETLFDAGFAAPAGASTGSLEGAADGAGDDGSGDGSGPTDAVTADGDDSDEVPAVILAAVGATVAVLLLACAWLFVRRRRRH